MNCPFTSTQDTKTAQKWSKYLQQISWYSGSFLGSNPLEKFSDTQGVRINWNVRPGLHVKWDCTWADCTQECHLFISTKYPFLPHDVLNLAVWNIFYLQSCMESAFRYNLGSTNRKTSIEELRFFKIWTPSRSIRSCLRTEATRCDYYNPRGFKYIVVFLQC